MADFPEKEKQEEGTEEFSTVFSDPARPPRGKG